MKQRPLVVILERTGAYGQLWAHTVRPMCWWEAWGHRLTQLFSRPKPLADHALPEGAAVSIGVRISDDMYRRLLGVGTGTGSVSPIQCAELAFVNMPTPEII